MKHEILEYGGHGVNVALESFTYPGSDTVFWSEPHKNSFVLVADEKGNWRTADGQRVALISINGIGEIRWRVETYDKKRHLDAIEHFQLTEVPRG